MAPDRDPPTPSEPNYGAARAFARVGWPKVWARLYLYATGTLRLAAIDAESAGVVEAADLVVTLLVTSLDGALGWTLPEEATQEQILGLACAKLHGMCWTLQRRAARTVYYDDARDDRADPGPDTLTRLTEARGLLDLERILAHDAAGASYLRRMLEGKKREEIMAEVGCTAEHADVVRKRIVRGIAAHVRRMNDDGDDAPPSSGCQP